MGESWVTIWERNCDRQLALLRQARNADEVLVVLSDGRYIGRGFYGGGDGGEVASALAEAGWVMLNYRASYHWLMRAPDGSMVTYVEGDVFEGDQMPRAR